LRPIVPLTIWKSSAKAYDYSLKHHTGQTRASGQPYLVHPLEVAMVLAEMKLDSGAIAAGLLHDAIEDTEATREDIKREFGEQVANIVEGVTKIDKIDVATSKEERQAENGPQDDPGNGRRHPRGGSSNLPTGCTTCARWNIFRRNAQQQISRETLDIYASIAHRWAWAGARSLKTFIPVTWSPTTVRA